MTNTKRWLDELPLESSERELLLAGKRAEPPRGAIDADWQALCLVLGASAAAPAAVAASSNAASSVSAKAASSLMLSKAGAAGSLVPAVVKSLALGFGLGLGVVGASAVVQRVSQGSRPASVARQSPALGPRPGSAKPTPRGAEASRVTAAPALSAIGATATFPTQAEPHVTSEVSRAPTAAPAPSNSPSGTSTSLSQQARELVDLKRLIDIGDAAEALRRFDQHANGSALSSLSEERDALYVEALAQVQRHAEARLFARRFLARYPHSPYLGTMRQLSEE